MLVPDPHTQTGERSKILDFGLAKLTGQKGAAQVRTQSNAVMGTPLYMSPEQCEGPSRVDAKTDVYSLGAIFYELLAGRQPFLGESLGQVIAGHMFKEPEPLATLAPEVPVPLVGLVHRMLAKDKAQRPSMAELAVELSALFDLAPPPTRRSQDAHPLNTSAEVRALGLAKTEAESDSALGWASTLGPVLGQGRRMMAAASRRWLLSGAGALALLLITVWLVGRGRPGPKVAADVAAGGAVPVAAPRHVVLGVKSEPPGASVIRVSDGQQLGTTPWQQEQEAQPGELTVILRLSGYVEREISLDLEKGGIHPVALAALSGTEPASASPPASRIDTVASSPHNRAGKHGTSRHSRSAGSTAKQKKANSHESLPIEN